MLEVRTIILNTSLAYFLATIIACVLAMLRFPVRGTMWWALGSVGTSIGCLLMALRGFIPITVSTIPAFFFLVGGMLLFWNGIRLFVGLPKLSKPVMIVVLGGLLLLTSLIAWAVVVQPNYPLRTTLYAFSFTVISAGISITFFRYGPNRPGILFTGTLYGIWAVCSFVWFFSGLTNATPPTSLLSDTSTMLAAFVTTIHKYVSASALVFIVGEFMEHRLRQRETELGRDIAHTNAAVQSKHVAVENSLRFTDMISHEFRTPLSVISMHMDILEMFLENDQKSLPSSLVSIRNTVDTLQGDISNRLNRERLTAMGHSQQFSTLDLREIITNAIQEGERTKECSVDFWLPDHPVTVEGIPSMLQAMFRSFFQGKKQGDPNPSVRLTQERDIVTIRLRPVIGSVSMEALRQQVALHHGDVESVVNDPGLLNIWFPTVRKEEE